MSDGKFHTIRVSYRQGNEFANVWLDGMQYQMQRRGGGEVFNVISVIGEDETQMGGKIDFDYARFLNGTTLQTDPITNPLVIGKDGVIKPETSEESRLCQLISLPADDDDIMPAEGDPLSQEQIELIHDWI